jgi:hypothetical protein
MRKRLRKKSELKRIATAKKLFNLNKALAVAQLTVDTSIALSKLQGQPIGIRAIGEFHIRINYEAQLFRIRSTIFRDDKDMIKGCSIPSHILKLSKGLKSVERTQ